MNVYIVSCIGPEWNDVAAVFLTRKAAMTYANASTKKLRKKTDPISELSHFRVTRMKVKSEDPDTKDKK